MTAPAPRPGPGAVVFDLDGTLIDSRTVMSYAFRTAYQQTGGTGEAPVEEFLELLGAPFPSILTRLGLPATMDPAFRALAGSHINRIEVYQDAIGACHELRRRGVPLGLLTGKDRRRTEDILAHFGLTGLFDGLVAGDDPYRGKPEPDGLLGLCERLGVLPEHSVMVGDSPFDIAAGHAAGAATVGCLWGISGSDSLLAEGPDELVADPSGLLLALEKRLRLIQERSPLTALATDAGED